MSRKLFVNLAVKDLAVTVDFFKQLGFEFNPQFSDDNAACLVVSDEAMVMLLHETYYRTFTSKQLVDTATASETMLAISAETREEVDALVDRALAAGGSTAGQTMDQPDFMYGRSFDDPDGHTWEVIWMNPQALAG